MEFCTIMHLDYLKNTIEFQGHTQSQRHMFLCVFCVHDTAATRGQYLALSQAWQ